MVVVGGGIIHCFTRPMAEVTGWVAIDAVVEDWASEAAALYSPTLAAAAVSPELMSQRLLAPGRTRRFAVRPSPIGPGLGTPQTEDFS